MTVIFWRSAALLCEIYEKNPKDVQVVWPMTNGVIANLTEAEIVLSHLLKSFSGILHRDVTLYIAVPSDITQVEKRAFFQVMRGKIGAGRIRLIDKGIADAVSAERRCSPRATYDRVNMVIRQRFLRLPPVRLFYRRP